MLISDDIYIRYRHENGNRSTCKTNRGSAVVEACVVIPLFLFMMLFVMYVYRMLFADAHIHQCLAEATVYCAQRCYLEDRLMSSPEENGSEVKEYADINSLVNTGIIYAQFRKYIGDDEYVEQVVAGGKNGIIITVDKDKDNNKIFIAKAVYYTELKIPILGSFRMLRSNEVKEKAFLGYSAEEAGDDSDIYVYITPNESVYHLSRTCTHLAISVRTTNGHGNYEPCSFCGKDKGSKVYVTDSGNAYHYNINCLGLKRTVMRVKKSEVAGLKVCSRCGK